MSAPEQNTPQITTPPPLTPQQSTSPQQMYQDFVSEVRSLWTSTKTSVNELSGWDQRSARCITDFKKDYILSIGDLMNRSICMAIAGGATYKLVSFNKPSLIRRTRNLAGSFLLSGWLFVPELFNPFLPKLD